ncbi:MAG: DsrE family protein [Pirellulaceae bacterium]
MERIRTMNGFVLASQPKPKDFKQARKGVTETGTFEEPIGPAARQGVNVVYQVETDAWKKDVAAGLHYLDKLARIYGKLGIGPKDREIVGVFHGDAGHFLLKDPAFQKATEKSGKNPNKQIVKDLLDAGVRLELCKSTMENHGWTGDDVLPGVQIVVGAYPRIIDLQLRGYAYIHF